jgi:enamine deaminase RidA (YjgF/YER057c/UK114 family)
MSRQTYSSGSPWEPKVGYSRAVHVGNTLAVAGTTATDADGRVVAPGDIYAQTRYILDRLSGVLAEAGFRMDQVVRTRMYVTDISRWQEVGRAHGEVFGNIRPASTMVEVRALIDPEHLIEIELDAVRE